MAKGGVLRVIFGDQLSPKIAALRDLDRERDTVLLMEVREEGELVPSHRQRIALFLAAMRHFSAALAARKVRVEHIRLDDPANTQSLDGEVARAVERVKPSRIVVTWPGEWRLLAQVQGWEKRFGLPVEIREDDRFLASRQDFADWAEERKALRMEFFYREMRRRYRLLMEGDEPAGGRWNFDPENRAALPAGIEIPAGPRFPPDLRTKEVIALVEREFPKAFGRIESFDWPVSAKAARLGLEAFLEQRLPRFGDFQDAMAEGEPRLFHSLVSTSLNLGLLDPLEVCEAAEREWREGRAPLNAVEGFIRQILGWREFVRGLYWHFMPDYAERNEFQAQRDLPGFYWTGETRMNCLAQAIGQTRDFAYAHHIQRLMVTGNFALLAGIAPKQVSDWYLAVYADAVEWVQLPNTHGMALFADGGTMGSKPYAASGAYINRQSDYCGRCAYDPKKQTGEKACPFNFLYWDFVARHADRLAGNTRMAMPLKNLARMAPEKIKAMRSQAAAFLKSPAMSPDY